jgi:hypothetical protein
VAEWIAWVLAVVGIWILLSVIVAGGWGRWFRLVERGMPRPQGRLEVQGIVSVQTGEPLVQFRQIVDDEVAAEWQTGVNEARGMAQQIVEAAMNATYDGAIVAWAKQTWPDEGEQMAARMLLLIRDFRADTWGLPEPPKDWRGNGAE